MTMKSIPQSADNICGIYTITCTANGRVYVGSSIDIARRIRSHVSELDRGVHKNGYLRNSWAKYGESAFHFDVIEHVENPNNLLEREQWWMDSLDTVKNGFNISPKAGNTLGIKFSDEGRQNLSNAMRGKPGRKHSEETKRKISEQNRGRIFSEEHRRKISEKARDRHPGEETRRKLSAASKGRVLGPMSEETKRKLSEAKIGRKLSEEHRQKIAETSRRNGCEMYINNSKLKPEDVANIKKLLAQGVRGADIAREYNVRPQIVSAIKVGTNWSHIAPATD